jgi:hypothetical protein
MDDIEFKHQLLFALLEIDVRFELRRGSFQISKAQEFEEVFENKF